MVTGVIALYESLDIPCNEPKDVANTMLHTLSGERSGEALYVSGSQTYELEKMLEKVKPEWLGQQVYDELMAGQTALGGVCFPQSLPSTTQVLPSSDKETTGRKLDKPQRRQGRGLQRAGTKWVIEVNIVS